MGQFVTWVLALQAGASPIPSKDPFLQKWLEEDAVYIITEAEKFDYQDLKSDAERYQFIEQFWLRRDPTPETVENESRNEHYRRIAYANERFASKQPGWKTDRGRTYIAWGPPDEIESHSPASNERPAFEVWRYNRVEVPLERVFELREGEYEAASEVGSLQ